MFTLDGMFDLHLHAGPDVVVRSGDDLTFALKCKEAGMAGFAVKAMLESTVSRAYYVNKMVEGFRMVGGICLNYAVGGINPAAVDFTLRSGGRVVWMPTGHAAFHARIKGELGNWGPKNHKLYNPPGAKGISIVDENGNLTPEIKDVVALVKEHNALIGTSHISPEESLKLIRYCVGEGVKVVFTHLGWTPEYDLEVGKAAIEAGGMVELTAVTFGGFVHKRPLAECVEWINTLGPKNLVLSSDTGALRSIMPHEILRSFGINLVQNGISEENLRLMMGTNPLALIAE